MSKVPVPPIEIVCDIAKKIGEPLTENQRMVIAGSLAVLLSTAHKQGLARAREICDKLAAPESATGIELSMWEIGTIDCADAITAELEKLK